MEKEFWEEAWESGRTRFHKDRPHQELVENISFFENTKKVFVPLCGKSLDMIYLRDQGYKVVGVELSPLAIQAFINENQLSPKVTQTDKHTVFEMEGITLYQGDFFELSTQVLSDIDGLYDRAALVALPPQMRQCYAQFIKEKLEGLQKMLLLSFEYEQEKASGPPFSVNSAEIKNLYQDDFKMTEFLREQTDDLNPRFQDKGIKEFWHTGYFLESK